MFTKNRKISLVAYWTRSYVLTLVIGLAVLMVASVIWLKYNAKEQRLEVMALYAEMMVERLTDDRVGPGGPDGPLPEMFRNGGMNVMRDINPIIVVTDLNGQVVGVNPPIMQPSIPVDGETLTALTETVSKVSNGDEQFYVVRRPIVVDDADVGYVFAMENEQQVTRINQQFGYVIALIVGLGLLGWAAIYVLSKRLTKPILEVADAAKRIQGGHYQVAQLALREDFKELEIDALVSSFREMAGKLEQLEKTRTELLAGVTHELKTPITSISGLLAAVKDGVVDGKQAEQFIRMAYDETLKMKTMVGDLLAFNSYAVDAVPIQLVEGKVSDAIAQVAIRFEATRGVRVQLTEGICTTVQVYFDRVRLEQILSNLFTNAIDACDGPCEIKVSCTDVSEEFLRVDVADNGPGIPEADQPFIFEKFYRGEAKKYAVRGLGLGLALSKMMAKSMQGDLVLKETSSAGTTFSLYVKKIL